MYTLLLPETIWSKNYFHSVCIMLGTIVWRTIYSLWEVRHMRYVITARVHIWGLNIPRFWYAEVLDSNSHRYEETQQIISDVEDRSVLIISYYIGDK